MPGKRSLSLTMEEVIGRFDEWRRHRQRGAPIPQELWMTTASLARRNSVNRAGTALHLDGSKLKQLMGAVPGKAMPTGFVEFMAPQVGQSPRVHD
jgi:hypothetical protein